jgi:hypothetical protein
MPHLPLDKVKLLTQMYECTFDELVDAFVLNPQSNIEKESLDTIPKSDPVAA